jgi:hypothetical protein
VNVVVLVQARRWLRLTAGVRGLSRCGSRPGSGDAVA